MACKSLTATSTLSLDLHSCISEIYTADTLVRTVFKKYRDWIFKMKARVIYIKIDVFTFRQQYKRLDVVLNRSVLILDTFCFTFFGGNARLSIPTNSNSIQL